MINIYNEWIKKGKPDKFYRWGLIKISEKQIAFFKTNPTTEQLNLIKEINKDIYIDILGVMICSFIAGILFIRV